MNDALSTEFTPSSNISKLHASHFHSHCIFLWFWVNLSLISQDLNSLVLFRGKSAVEIRTVEQVTQNILSVHNLAIFLHQNELNQSS